MPHNPDGFSCAVRPEHEFPRLSSPGAGSVIVIDREQTLGEWLVLDDTATARRCWCRGTSAERRLVRAVYEPRVWGNAIALAMVDPATSRPHDVKVRLLGQRAQAVPSILIPAWGIAGMVPGDQVEPDVLARARSRCVLYTAEGVLAASLKRELTEKFEEATRYVREGFLKQ